MPDHAEAAGLGAQLAPGFGQIAPGLLQLLGALGEQPPPLFGQRLDLLVGLLQLLGALLVGFTVEGRMVLARQ